ncbi:MAG TPA: hypothetical protein VKU41_25075, partial [Polyangiaceae bacterium]|nr:hypothetical protein [Polyangiaceae bacterium]
MKPGRSRARAVALGASAWGLAGLLGCSSGTHARADGGPGSDTACPDTMFDPHNCGACGHDCGGGACQNGACVALAPGVLATGQGQPGAVVVDDTNVYWANAKPPAILACAKAGCANAPTVLAQGAWGPPTDLVL